MFEGLTLARIANAIGVKGFALIAAMLALGGLYLHDRHITHQRDELAQWKSDVVALTRNAAHRPHLAENQVGLQITYLGQQIDSFIAAQQAATAIAKAAKAEQERKDEERKHHAQDALPARIDDQRRRSAEWIATHRLRDEPPSGPVPDAGGAGRPDLPRPAFGAPVGDRPDSGSGLVAVPEPYIAACDAVTARLHNIRDDWWRGINPDDFGQPAR